MRSFNSVFGDMNESWPYVKCGNCPAVLFHCLFLNLGKFPFTHTQISTYPKFQGDFSTKISKTFFPCIFLLLDISFHHISLTWPPWILVSGSLVGFLLSVWQSGKSSSWSSVSQRYKICFAYSQCLETAISYILSHSLLYCVEDKPSPSFSNMARSGILVLSFLIAQFSFYLLVFIFHTTVGSSGFHSFQQSKPSRNSF